MKLVQGKWKNVFRIPNLKIPKQYLINLIKKYSPPTKNIFLIRFL